MNERIYVERESTNDIESEIKFGLDVIEIAINGLDKEFDSSEKEIAFMQIKARLEDLRELMNITEKESLEAEWKTNRKSLLEEINLYRDGKFKKLIGQEEILKEAVDVFELKDAS